MNIAGVETVWRLERDQEQEAMPHTALRRLPLEERPAGGTEGGRLARLLEQYSEIYPKRQRPPS